MCDEAMAIRVVMAKEGWYSEDRLSDIGWDKVGYSIWFRRWDWHGKKLLKLIGNYACYHARRPGVDKILETVKEASERARYAWNEYPELPPVQIADDSLHQRNVLNA